MNLPGNLDLYLLAGQSNMAGRGQVTEADRLPAERVWVFNQDNQWVQQGEPIHFDKSLAGVGLGFTFAKQMAAADPGANIGLIPCAVGGTPVSRWLPGGDLFAAAVERAKAARPAGQWRGILWHQGESECGEAERAAAYGANLTLVLEGFRRELGTPELPVAIGELGEYLYTRSENRSPHAREVNAQIATMPERIRNAAVVSSAGLTDLGDELHFNAESLKEFGVRYAAALRQLPALADSSGEILYTLVPPADADPRLPDVLLLGDSISLGYAPFVREKLRDRANVYHIRGTEALTVMPAGGLRLDTWAAREYLHAWLGSKKWRVIHFNWGLHDLKLDAAGQRIIDLEEYERNLRELAGRLQATGAALIWASTTPVPPGTESGKIRRIPGSEAPYNAAAASVMREAGIPVDDLHAVVAPALAEWQRPADVHFTEKGSRRLADSVTASIQPFLAGSRDR